MLAIDNLVWNTEEVFHRVLSLLSHFVAFWPPLCFLEHSLEENSVMRPIVMNFSFHAPSLCGPPDIFKSVTWFLELILPIKFRKRLFNILFLSIF